jgi:hypothetical protein
MQSIGRKNFRRSSRRVEGIEPKAGTAKSRSSQSIERRERKTTEDYEAQARPRRGVISIHTVSLNPRGIRAESFGGLTHREVSCARDRVGLSVAHTLVIDMVDAKGGQLLWRLYGRPSLAGCVYVYERSVLPTRISLATDRMSHDFPTRFQTSAAGRSTVIPRGIEAYVGEATATPLTTRGTRAGACAVATVERTTSAITPLVVMSPVDGIGKARDGVAE